MTAVRTEKRRPPLWHDQHSLVVFGDMLGFGSLVESHSDTTEGRLRRITRDWEVRRERTPNRTFKAGARQSSRMERQFILFNDTVNRSIIESSVQGPVTAMVFSDSFFIAMNDGPDMLLFCAHLMVSLVTGLIPVRMGIAQGSFCLHDHQQSDGAIRRLNTTQFLGKGVVRAHLAESSGLKGMRIGLHSSLIGAMPELLGGVALPLPRAEKNKGCAHELNYLHSAFLSDEAKSVPELVVQGVKAMESSVDQRSKHREHYTCTRLALSRMLQAARAESPFR